VVVGAAKDLAVVDSTPAIPSELLRQLYTMSPDAIRSRLDVLQAEQRVLSGVLRDLLAQERRRRKAVAHAS
jgi:hypothetical protein